MHMEEYIESLTEFHLNEVPDLSSLIYGFWGYPVANSVTSCMRWVSSVTRAWVGWGLCIAMMINYEETSNLIRWEPSPFLSLLVAIWLFLLGNRWWILNNSSELALRFSSASAGGGGWALALHLPLDQVEKQQENEVVSSEVPEGRDCLPWFQIVRSF